MTFGPAIVPAIVIDRNARTGGPRTLTPLDPDREPNRQTFWFGAELAPAGNQVWFRVTLEAVRRMQEETPGARGNRRRRPPCRRLRRPLSDWRMVNRFQAAPNTRTNLRGD